MKKIILTGLMIAIYLWGLVSLQTISAFGCLYICFEQSQTETIWCGNDLPEEQCELISIPPEQNSSIQYISGQVYVKFRTPAHPLVDFKSGQNPQTTRWAALLEPFGITAIQKAFPRLPEMELYYRIKFDKSELTAELISRLERFPYVEFAEKVPQHKTFLTPNDIHPNQYNVLITQAEQAWDITTGNSNIVIGMVDDAVRLDHEDLAANIWTNPGEIAGNGIDDDGNGYIDDINGWDAADNDNNPNPPASADNFNFSHGTHCAGIAAAVTDNGTGIASVSFNVSLMAVKIADDATDQLTGAIEGVEYAIASGADVISMSWGGGAPSATEQAVFTTAHNQGIVLIAAAGNDNTSELMYPASYQYVISVGASDDNDLRADFSNFGDSIDVMAPGVQIWSTVATSTSAYEFYDGTSMACPYVAGLAALMLSFDPTATPDRIEQCLEETADNIDGLNPGFEGQLGAGRVNAFLAVQCTPSEPIANFTWSAQPPCAGEVFTFLDLSAGTELDSWQWSFPGGTPFSSTAQFPTVSYPTSGSYEVTLTVSNYLGTSTITKTVIIAPPSAYITGAAVILLGYVVPVEVSFTGSPPWTFTYSNGASTQTVSGVTENPYILNLAPQFTTTYTLTSMSNPSCTGTVGGTATIVVIVPSEINDICDNALPFPALSIGTQSCIIGNNENAFAELPYINQNNCAGIPMPGPAADLWYSFVAVSNILDVSLTFDMDTAVVALYEGACNALIGRDCAVSTTGNINATFAPVTPGLTYHIQISGGSAGDTGDFQLCLENYGETIDEICMLGQSLVATPPPVLGTYLPGQNVLFCFTVEGYNQNAADWFHGLVPVLGNGWDASTLTPTSIPPPCSGGGAWDWYTTPVVSDGGGSGAITGPQGPGFFFESDAGCPGVCDPLDPGDNFGDPTDTGCGWEFCFTVSTLAACPPAFDGQNLSITFRNFSDSETGSWGVVSICPDDPEYTFKAVLSCCAIPEMTGTFPTCAEPNIGVITATATAGIPPFEFAWSTGFVESNNNSSTISNLPAGFYIVTVTDSEGCAKEASFTLIAQNNFTIEVSEDPTICGGDGAQLNVIGGVSYVWAPSTGLSANNIANPVASPESTTQYVVVATDASGCTAYGIITVNVNPDPDVDAGQGGVICPGESINLSASGGFAYSWSPPDGLSVTNFSNPVATPAQTTTYTVTVTGNYGCSATDNVTVIVAPPPFFPVNNIDTVACSTDVLELQLTDINFISNYNYEWSPTTGLSNPNIPNPVATVTSDITYTITVTNPQGCQTVRTVDIILNNADFSVNLGADTVLCNGGTLNLNAGAGFESYLWSNGSTTESITASESGVYSVTITNDIGCSATDEIDISIDSVQPEITGNLTITEEESTTLSTQQGFSQYLWSNSAVTPSITVSDGGEYAVSVTNSNGCTGMDAVTVQVLNRNELLIPSAFSPNGDGMNDLFRVVNSNPVESFNLIVYNRWGNQLYETDNILSGWNGAFKNTDSELGVYVYFIEVTFVGDVTKTYHGNVTLIR
ncbi:MAG: S8 family serine peptidase [Sphingobacteriales bacterium]|nr:MAG: S8 family serine peptidase [Sphingobacteriales bacterium]